MKISKTVLASLGLGLLIAVAGPVLASPPAGYTLHWSDEFSGAPGTQPNPATWTYDLGGGGHGNGELETYVNDTAHVKFVSDSNATDGIALDITATNDGGLYHSGRIKTEGLHTEQFGYIEYRTVEGPSGDPTGRGIWPANWAMGSNFPTVGWPTCGEMDIFEDIGQTPFRNVASLHMPGHAGGNPLSGTYNFPSGQSISSGYHLYGDLWQQDVISFYVDNNLFETHHASEVSAGQWTFNHPFFFLINMAVGGAFPGPPNSGTVFPQDMHVDYLRFYTPGSGGPPPTPTNVSASAGNASVTVSWSASSGATSYSIFRSTVSGAEGTTAIATTGSTSFTNTGLTNNTKYFYKVSASNSSGMSAQSSEVSATPTSGGGGGGVSINCGGGAASPFSADMDFAGGVTSSTTHAIDTSQLSGSIPPQAVLQTNRHATCTYTIGGLAAGNHTVTLYFEEHYWTAAGKRLFNVVINGTTVLTNFDIFASAGGQFRAIQRTFTTSANGSGQVVINFNTVLDNALVNGITVN